MSSSRIFPTKTWAIPWPAIRLLARSVRRASVASGKETSAPEMRPMTRAALAQLARFKKERAKTHLERMWDRRASAAPGVGAEADQFR